MLDVTLPDHHASGQREGIGFGCSPAPSDVVILLGMLAALDLVPAGLVVSLLIALTWAWRRHREGAGTSRGGSSQGEGTGPRCTNLLSHLTRGDPQ